MKKLLFSLMAIAFLSFTVNAQKVSKEEARVYAAKVLLNFKSTLHTSYKNSVDFEDFVKIVTYPNNSTTMPNEGKELLKVAYVLLSNNTSDKEIISTYSGKEVANAYKFLKAHPSFDETQLFGFKIKDAAMTGGKGGPSIHNDAHVSDREINREYPCKWYQIKCHLNEIVGEAAADIIMTALIALLL
ncbi:hypothetical protein FLAN108750_09545 [Flavobacterium antarcticum]|uniref:hypothetical protein n=1 Tax=Flavobacterium antarcticum TaxID=271155 RepID=UPI0003B5CF90|nr:hypothetical protein [Flavobacterium antarcticum]